MTDVEAQGKPTLPFRPRAFIVSGPTRLTTQTRPRGPVTASPRWARTTSWSWTVTAESCGRSSAGSRRASPGSAGTYASRLTATAGTTATTPPGRPKRPRTASRPASGPAGDSTQIPSGSSNPTRAPARSRPCSARPLLGGGRTVDDQQPRSRRETLRYISRPIAELVQPERRCPASEHRRVPAVAAAAAEGSRRCRAG